LILPYHFRDGIIRREQEWLAKGGKFILPLPLPGIISSSPSELLTKMESI
jgi:hypothetical protein